MELVMLIIHANVILDLSLIKQLRNVSSLVMDSQALSAMVPIFSLAQAVLEVHVITVRVFAGQDLQALIARQNKQ